MIGTVVLLIVVVAAVAALVAASGRARARESERKRHELEPVKRLAFEDVTAFGEELRRLDAELSGRVLDEGASADYQRALDAYESAKQAGDAMGAPEDIAHVTRIVEDGRYAVACVRARVAGEPLPTRRPPCFFDPRHGPSVEDVRWAPPGGTPRDVPACALDVERVSAGAEPDVRQVMVGPRRVPYWQGGPAYQPYAAGYFSRFSPMDWLFTGLMFDAFGGFDLLGGIGDGIGEAIGGIGDGIGEAMGDIGGGIGDVVDGIGDGIGDLFDGFDL